MAGVEAADDEGEAGVSRDSDVERKGVDAGDDAAVVFGFVLREGGGEGVLEGDREGDILVVDIDIVFRP